MPWPKHFFLTSPRSTRLSPHLAITKTTMNIRISKSALAAMFVAVFAVAAYWHWSPFLAIREMQSAAKVNDADAFNTHVDYPRLRESLKGQFSSLMAEQMAKSTDSKNPSAAFGTMLGLSMVDKLVDAMVRPKTVMRGMRSGQFGRTSSPPDADTGTSASPSNESEKPKWSYVRKGTDKLIAYPQGGAEPADKKVAIVFERSGFAKWKITELRIQSLKP
jgi:Protein of unknown function (DUF2939)